MLDELPFRLANGLCIPSSLYHHKRTRANDLQLKFFTQESEAMLKDFLFPL